MRRVKNSTPIELFDPEIEGTLRKIRARRNLFAMENNNQGANNDGANDGGANVQENPQPQQQRFGVGLNPKQIQYVSNGNYNYQGNNMPNYYHQGFRNHENFSYANNKNVMQPPPGFNAQPQAEKKQSLEDILGTFMMETNKLFNKNEARFDNIEIHMSNMGATMKNIEVQKKLDDQFSKLLKIFKKINTNIPFVDSLEKIPNYVKFMKEDMSKKINFEDYKTVKLTEECSAIVLKKLPQKLKVLGNFTIPCKIGGLSFDKVLCDLGASINLMSLSFFKKLVLEEVKPTTITLQLANRSFTYPRGVIEDVLAKVDKFLFLADFVALDMEEDHEIPLILGRSFLATGGALIDVQAGHLTLRVNEEEVRFNIYNGANWPVAVNTCKRIESFYPLVSGDQKERYV
ncbi:uncharacterized protein LOC133815519 [Humulus lupulus]|uniref:uncharacterized protein LOC133815519 n=1 Tax=Humulus lupulus TaxID=3486 RepID=UPI002B404700|nr:uncharacterized protein LOC133815519 [Humulus lupulus]